MILGCIGDDFTGSSDLGLMLASGGMRTVLYVGVPNGPADPAVEAGIVALKSRTAPVAEAVAQSLTALDWLRAQGCQTFFLKVCSTFDSTPEGNIGPVAEALAEALGWEGPVPICPAFPATGRSVYQGHLFVGDRLLSESGMERHPLTPMTDPDLRRWLARQSRRGVGHLPLAALHGAAARERLEAEAAAGRPLVICDAMSDDDLRRLGPALEGLPLLVGASGLALPLPALLNASEGGVAWQGQDGPVLILSGSCSAATRAQVARHREAGHSVRRVSVDAVLAGTETPEAALAWARAAGPLPLLASTDDPEAVVAAQARHGRDRAAEALDRFFGDLGRLALERGVRRLIVAGGETSGAVVLALGTMALEIGPAIAPGVPALAVSGRPLALALKSGNFGAPDFFESAARVLEGR